jgi:L-rhamnose mutarotase
MPTFLLISRHSPESCWMFNEKNHQIHRDLFNQLESLLQKYHITMIGCWFDIPGHTLYEVYDAPSLEAFQKMGMEPVIAAWGSFNTMEIRMVSPLEEIKGMIRSEA